MLSSCNHNVSNFTNPTFYTLTLIDRNGNEYQKIYYNIENRKWYDENKNTITSVDTFADIKYEITLKCNGGTFNGKSENQKILTLTSVFRGYGKDGNVKIFKGASDDVLLDEYSITEDTELVTMWDIVLLGNIDEPTKDGYTFNGWFDGDTQYNAQSEITSNITLTAHWKENTV